MTEIDPDEISRTMLAFINSGQASSLEAAKTLFDGLGVVIVADAPMCASICGQAAILTAAATAARAFGRVAVHLGKPEAVVEAGLHTGTSIGEATKAVVSEAGRRITPLSEMSTTTGANPVILIGVTDPGEQFRTAPVVLRATWTGWRAHVLPEASRSGAAPAVPDEAMPLAAIASAAIAVSEAFAFFRGRPGAGFREVLLNLWDPKHPEGETGPQIRWLPADWWILGLGHLGQANAWALSWLPYGDRGSREIVLQDTDILTKANVSTGLLSSHPMLGRRKTRVIADALDRAGFKTTIVERLLDRHQRAAEADAHVMLVGLDRVAPRRLLDGISARFVVDVGLGRGSEDFTAVSLHAFPGPVASAGVPSWQHEDDAAVTEQTLRQPAYQELAGRLDQCGLAILAGKAVAAAFVGTVAACLAVAEPIRRLHSGTALAAMSLDLRHVAPRCARTSITPQIAYAKI